MVDADSGEIAATEGAFEVAIDRLARAVKREDVLNYDEPPNWHYPKRQGLGAVNQAYEIHLSSRQNMQGMRNLRKCVSYDDVYQAR